MAAADRAGSPPVPAENRPAPSGTDWQGSFSVLRHGFPTQYR